MAQQHDYDTWIANNTGYFTTSETDIYTPDIPRSVKGYEGYNFKGGKTQLILHRDTNIVYTKVNGGAWQTNNTTWHNLLYFRHDSRYHIGTKVPIKTYLGTLAYRPERAKLALAVPPKPSSWIGYSCDITADGSAVVLGAYQHTTVYLYEFERNINRWGFDHLISAPVDRNGDRFGYSVAISADALSIVVGSYGANYVDVYTYDDDLTIYQRRGQRLKVSTTRGQLGKCCDISADGNTIACGAGIFQYISFFTYDSTSKTWKPKGTTIDKAKTDLVSSDFGESCSLTPDGNTVVIGAHSDHYVEVYEYVAGDWKLKGNTVSTRHGHFGKSVAISADGNTFAAGAPYRVHTVTIYKYNASSNTWEVKGNVIGSSKNKQNYGFGYSCAISADGNIVAAGAPRDNYVEVYIYDNGTWKLRSPRVTGNGEFGWCCSLSADGDRLVVGAPKANYGEVYRYKAAKSEVSYGEYYLDVTTKKHYYKAPTVTTRTEIKDHNFNNILEQQNPDFSVSPSEFYNYPVYDDGKFQMSATNKKFDSPSSTVNTFLGLDDNQSYQFTGEIESNVYLRKPDGTGKSIAGSGVPMVPAELTKTITITASKITDTATKVIRLTKLTKATKRKRTMATQNLIKWQRNNTGWFRTRETSLSGLPDNTEGYEGYNIKGGHYQLVRPVGTTDTYTKFGKGSVWTKNGKWGGVLWYLGSKIGVMVAGDRQWKLKGSRIIGSGRSFGASSDISSDGSVVVIGSYNAHYAEVYEFTGGQWKLKGSRLTGGRSGFGHSSGISSDGSTVVIGPYRGKYVAVYEFTGGQWKLKGSRLVARRGFGYSSAISSDGSTVVIGKYARDYAEVYEFTGGQWELKGSRLTGSGRSFGASADISSDGSVVVVGARDDNYAEVYEFTGGQWKLKGSRLTGSGDFGFQCSLSSDGSVVAVGADDGNYVEAYEFTGGQWKLKGKRIQGHGSGSKLGYTASLDGSGNRLLVGDAASAYVEVYDFNGNNWVIVGKEITGDNTLFGYKSHISKDGTTIIVGNPDKNYVEVYSSVVYGNNKQLYLDTNDGKHYYNTKEIKAPFFNNIMEALAPYTTVPDPIVLADRNVKLTATDIQEQPNKTGNYVSLLGTGTAIVASTLTYDHLLLDLDRHKEDGNYGYSVAIDAKHFVASNPRNKNIELWNTKDNGNEWIHIYTWYDKEATQTYLDDDMVVFVTPAGGFEIWDLDTTTYKVTLRYQNTTTGTLQLGVVKNTVIAIAKGSFVSIVDISKSVITDTQLATKADVISLDPTGTQLAIGANGTGVSVYSIVGTKQQGTTITDTKTPSSVAIAGNILVVGDKTAQTVIIYENRAEVARLTGKKDFGAIVKLAGDVLAVGAKAHVHIFKRVNNKWESHIDIQGQDNFGFSLDIHDGIMIVGNPKEQYAQLIVVDEWFNTSPVSVVTEVTGGGVLPTVTDLDLVPHAWNKLIANSSIYTPMVYYSDNDVVFKAGADVVAINNTKTNFTGTYFITYEVPQPTDYNNGTHIIEKTMPCYILMYKGVVFMIAGLVKQKGKYDIDTVVFYDRLRKVNRAMPSNLKAIIPLAFGGHFTRALKINKAYLGFDLHYLNAKEKFKDVPDERVIPYIFYLLAAAPKLGGSTAKIMADKNVVLNFTLDSNGDLTPRP